MQLKADAARGDEPTWRTLPTLAKVGTVVIWAVFVVYAIVLLKLLLFSRPAGVEQRMNLIPFATISHYLFNDAATVQRFALGNVVGNIVAFAPLGVFLPLLRRRTGIWTNLFIVVCASVAVEVVQGVFGLGSSDIDDVILNTLGGLVGILFFTALRLILRRWSRVIAVVAALSLLVVPVFFYLLFVVRLQL